jgi:asparagine synthase (glutamine-hydrolysing)
MSVFDAPARETLTTEEFRKSLGAFEGENFLRDAFARTGKQGPAARAMAVDLETYLPGDLLVKTDVASMSHGLEVRCPFLDHRLVEFARGVPEWMMLSAFTGKRLLRETFRHELPRRIRRRKKMGFGVPLASWFRGELKGLLEDTLLSPSAATRGVLRPDALRALVDEHASGRADHGQRLYALLFLELWWQRFAQGGVENVRPPGGNQ